MNKCKKCGKDAEGYKCDMCGAESAEHDPNHQNPPSTCSGANCVPKCSACGEAETNCPC